MTDSAELTSDAARRGGNPEALSVMPDEALRLVQQVYFSQATAPRAVVFAGVDPGSGSSHICAAVAEALSRQSLRSVCLVDANFRSPALASLLGLTNHRGLTTALQSGEEIRSCGAYAGSGNLFVIPSGPVGGNSPSLLNSTRLRERVEELRAEFEYICFDVPPLTSYSDAIALAQLTDGAVLVLEAEKTRRDAAKAAASGLLASNVPVLAAVLNKRTFPIPEAIYKRL